MDASLKKTNKLGEHKLVFRGSNSQKRPPPPKKKQKKENSVLTAFPAAADDIQDFVASLP